MIQTDDMADKNNDTLNRNDRQQPQNKKGGRFFQPNFNWLFILIFAVLIGVNFLSDGNTSKQVNYTVFEGMVSHNWLQNIKINIDNNTASAEVVPDSIGKLPKSLVPPQQEKGKKLMVEVITPGGEATSKMLKDRGYKGAVEYVRDDNWVGHLLWTFGPVVLLVFLWIFLMRRMGGGAAGGGIFSVGKSKAQVFDKDNRVNVTFKDVAGLAGAKQEVEEIVEFLRNPKKYTDLGGKIPKGALLVGPPGTGKTLLAKAVAGEASVPFFSMSGSDFVEMFVGVGASRVRDLFRQAKEKAPCIIFIDEIDAVGRARGKNPNMGANDERENTLNQLLTEMDGFGTNSGVIILAATNRADILDKALLRAGRFDRQIHVELPDLQERKEIFQVHLRPIKTSDELDVDFLAKQTPGFSGADIANVCNEAALGAARKNKNAVDGQDFMDAVDRIVGGLEKRTKIMTNSEKKAIAFHEAGHATISWFLQYANPLVKVTIVPRGEALGAAWYLPEERVISNREHILDEMCATLGGRAAEELYGHTASTGAINDLERVTKRAYSMVAYFGMSESLSNLSFYDSTEAQYGFTKPYSEKTAELIDKEAQRIINEQYERAKRILNEHEEGHHQLAQILMDKEVIYTEDVEKIFGKRPWESRADELLADEKAAAEKMVEERDRKREEEQKALSATEQVEATVTESKEPKGADGQPETEKTSDNADVQTSAEPTAEENKEQ